MIIEIKDLPEGRKVSRILVDVTFDDAGESQSVSQSFLNESSIGPKTDPKVPEESVQAPASPVSPEIKRDPATNPSIPTEMLNMEF